MQCTASECAINYKLSSLISVMELHRIGILLLLATILASLTGIFSMELSSAVVVDPEESLFVFTRCIEDYALNDSLRRDRIRKWTSWKFDANADQQTKCFVRCFLEGLELYDESVGRFKTERLTMQYEQFKSFLICSRTEVNDLANVLNKYKDLKDCDLVYDAFLKVSVSKYSTFRQLFLVEHDIFTQAYLSLGSLVKQRDESMFHYCQQQVYKDKIDVWCAARNFTIPDDVDFPKYMDCIFRGLRYLNKIGNINVNEIIRDLHHIGIVDMDDHISTHLRGCPIEQEEQKALLYYKCLLNSSFKEQFKEALEYREFRSKYYHYMLVDPMPMYHKIWIQYEFNMENQRHCG